MNAEATTLRRRNATAQPEEKNSTIQLTRRTIEDMPGCLVLTLKGYLDTYNTLGFRLQVEEAIRSGLTRIVFDCAQVTYMSSQPIGYLASLVKELRSRGGDFVLVGLVSRVQEVVQLLGLGRWFTQAESVDEALALLEPRGAAGAAGPFPKIFDCPICRKRLRVLREGRYRCRECKTVIVVEPGGRFSIR